MKDFYGMSLLMWQRNEISQSNLQSIFESTPRTYREFRNKRNLIMWGGYFAFAWNGETAFLMIGVIDYASEIRWLL